MNKSELREYYSQKRSSLNNLEIKKLNNIIFSKFINSNIYKNSNKIMIYISFDSEIDTHRLINQILSDGKRVIVPITDSKNNKLIPSELYSMEELELGFYNILTPKTEFIRVFDKTKLDLIIVPGIVFDKTGYRLGYGGGYYDKFLHDLKNIPKISLCYDFQLIDSVPKESYDIPVNYILTDKRSVII